MVNWETVTEFEKQVAWYFGAPYAVAVDSCTHGIELALRYTNADAIHSPKQTYLSVPMLASKMGLRLLWKPEIWYNRYWVNDRVIDAAVCWGENKYVADSFMCLSFQYQKHLSLGRGGMILCPDAESWLQLKKMSYDGRLPGIPWRDQDINTMGYHYYMTPETAQQGLDKLQAAIDTPPRIWSHADYPDLTKMKIFKK